MQFLYINLDNQHLIDWKNLPLIALKLVQLNNSLKLDNFIIHFFQFLGYHLKPAFY